MSDKCEPQFLKLLQAGKPQKFVFYGTSLTAGGSWSGSLIELLTNRFPDLVTSLNTASPGEHSVWGLANFEERVLAHKPNVLFMEFAVNDSVARFHISKETSLQNLVTMLDLVGERLPNCEIILQAMNPVIDRPVGHDGHRPFLSEYYDQWRNEAKKRGLRLIDHYPNWEHLLKNDEASFRKYVPDGLHPQREGYDAIMVPHLFRELSL